MPTMKFGENQVVAIADKSLVFTLEFDEAFNLIFSIFIAYDRSALAYHWYTLSSIGILQCVSNKRPEFFKLNPNGQVPLLDTLDNHVCENIAIACCITLWHHQSILTCLQVESHNTLDIFGKER
ncbi:hypothetical protein MTR67_000351 [Solanum verrucosum]|uniref:GST N-terminal domain-containing protein n=1 Tax=Solanum verrucosum TaxID=315347 RepID=A0AAF0T6G5_SOLVR|nr:hypothetical protein MTR67_000351 [Solanum verrucosum]